MSVSMTLEIIKQDDSPFSGLNTFDDARQVASIIERVIRVCRGEQNVFGASFDEKILGEYQKKIK